MKFVRICTLTPIFPPSLSARTAEAGKRLRIALKPFEIVVFDAVPAL